MVVDAVQDYRDAAVVMGVSVRCDFASGMRAMLKLRMQMHAYGLRH